MRGIDRRMGTGEWIFWIPVILLPIRVGLGRFGKCLRAIVRGIDKRMGAREWIFRIPVIRVILLPIRVGLGR